MPDINGTHNGSQIIIPVMLQPVYPRTVRPDSFSMSNPARFEHLSGLIDTGANRTSITPQVASRLGLMPTGLVNIQGVGGPKLHNQFLFRLGFVDLRKDELGTVSPNVYFVDKDIEGPEFDCGPVPHFDILIGMDLLSACDLTIKRNGLFRLTV